MQEAGSAEYAIFHDVKVRSAIERQLMIISEAAIRLEKIEPAAGSRLAPNIDWAGIRGIGNFIRHKYDDLDTSILVDVIGGRLAELRTACQAALARVASEQ